MDCLSELSASVTQLHWYIKCVVNRQKSFKSIIEKMTRYEYHICVPTQWNCWMKKRRKINIYIPKISDVNSRGAIKWQCWWRHNHSIANLTFLTVWWNIEPPKWKTKRTEHYTTKHHIALQCNNIGRREALEESDRENEAEIIIIKTVQILHSHRSQSDIIWYRWSRERTEYGYRHRGSQSIIHIIFLYVLVLFHSFSLSHTIFSVSHYTLSPLLHMYRVFK